jgi:DNA-binding NarL/FixJ family response regulator
MNDVNSTIRVVIVNRSPIMASALASLIDSDSNFQVVAKASCCAECCGSIASAKPDLIICDLKSEELAGPSSLTRFRHCLPDVPTIVISDDDQEQRIIKIIKSGVQGLLTTDASPASLFAAARAVCRGGNYIDDSIQSKLLSLLGGSDPGNLNNAQLTDREKTILNLISDGLTNEQIGNAVCLSKSAIKYHNKSIFRKLGVSNRTEAAKVAMEQNLII